MARGNFFATWRGLVFWIHPFIEPGRFSWSVFVGEGGFQRRDALAGGGTGDTTSLRLNETQEAVEQWLELIISATKEPGMEMVSLGGAGASEEEENAAVQSIMEDARAAGAGEGVPFRSTGNPILDSAIANSLLDGEQ